jgi:hypothetical protein
MHERDEGKLLTLVGEVYGFYRKPFSKFAGSVWLNAMRPFEFEVVADALDRHCMNPDAGQYCPWPADVVKMLDGTTQDSALVGWSKVDRAVRFVGSWVDVVFDDPLIHRVISEMGGWIQLGERNSKDWDFVRNEFVNRYRGYKMRGERPEYPPVLTGAANAANSLEHQQRAKPVMIGNARLALAVMREGVTTLQIGITPMAALTEMRVFALAAFYAVS